jgi:hypothetical protein
LFVVVVFCYVSFLEGKIMATGIDTIRNFNDHLDAVGIVNATPEGGVLVGDASPLAVSNPMLNIAMGLVPGYSTMNKFGENPGIDTATDPEDIWDYGGLYVFSTTAAIDTISSSSVDDTEPITIVGLDANWDEVTQTKTLTGQTKAVLETPLIRVYRAYNTGTADIVGGVYIYEDGDITDGVPDDSSTIRALINNGNNQTLMCIYTVPAGKTAYFISGYVAYAKSSNTGAKFSWRARAFGGVFQVKSTVALIGTGSSTWDYHYGVPVALPEKADILIRCDEVESNGTAVAGGFDLILVDN